jgi:hypothetical protein
VGALSSWDVMTKKPLGMLRAEQWKKKTRQKNVSQKNKDRPRGSLFF